MKLTPKQIFLDLKNQFTKDYREVPFTLLLEMIGTIAALIASFTIGYFGPEANLNFVFASYLTSSVTMTISGYLRMNSFLIVLNLGFTVCNSMYFLRHFNLI